MPTVVKKLDAGSYQLKDQVVAINRVTKVVKGGKNLSFAALVVVGWGAGLGASYYAGVAVGAALIAYEHRLVRPDDLSRLNAAFFTVNGIVSVVVFAGALVDRIL